jgi:hypothetical protein
MQGMGSRPASVVDPVPLVEVDDEVVVLVLDAEVDDVPVVDESVEGPLEPEGTFPVEDSPSVDDSP